MTPFFYLCKLFMTHETRRQLICERECKAVPYVVVAVGTFKARMSAVLGLLRAIERNIVNRVRVGVAHHKVHTFPCPLRPRGLQPVVDGRVSVVEEVDEFQEGKTRPAKPQTTLSRGAVRSKRAPELLAPIIIRKIHLVDVSNTVELHAAVAYISHLQRCRRRKLLLYV